MLFPSLSRIGFTGVNETNEAKFLCPHNQAKHRQKSHTLLSQAASRIKDDTLLVLALF
jgi:hypothetical protein